MASHPGLPSCKIILKKKSQQFVAPTNNNFDINLTSYIGGFDTLNLNFNNIFFDPALGAAFIDPLFANRNNFIEAQTPGAEEAQAQFRTVEVPDGAPPETTNEINKRVFKPKPRLIQGALGGRQKKVDQEFLESGAVPLESDLNTTTSPLWSEVSLKPNFISKENSNSPQAAPVTWLSQTNTNPKTEFFMVQKYGNFTNESFWVDIRKFRSKVPADVPEEDTAQGRHQQYQAGFPIYNYIGFRLGSPTEDDSNSPGGYDVIFPIGGGHPFAFIYDHDGDNIDQGMPGDQVTDIKSPLLYNGYVASENRSFVIPDEIEEFRIVFAIIRNKLTIRASFTNEVWYFPTDLSRQPNEATLRKYSNFFIKGSKIIIHGRGTSFAFNFNPLEFNIYNTDGTEKKPHGSLTTYPMPIRTGFDWHDITGNINDDTDDKFQKFYIIPYDRGTTDVNGNPVSFAYGFDYVSDKYNDPEIGSNREYTSMMIPIDHDQLNRKCVFATTDPNSDFFGDSSCSVIRTYSRPPNANEDTPLYVGPAAGFVAEVNFGHLFENRFIVVELNCKEPTVGPYTSGISKRFASPVFWRIKGKFELPEPPVVEELDISKYVLGFSHSSTAPDVLTVEQNFSVDVYIPKGNQSTYHDEFNEAFPWDKFSSGPGVTNRQELIDFVAGGVREIEVWAGWYKSNCDRTKDPALEFPPGNNLFQIDRGCRHDETLAKIFTGLTSDINFTTKYDRDVITITCEEKTSVLKKWHILNSPFFDGMNLVTSFFEIGTLSGLPRSFFRVRSITAIYRQLPMGFTFQEPKVAFKNNETIYDALLEIAKTFGHTVRTDPDGKVVLGDLYSDPTGIFSDIVEDIPLTHPNFVFYEDGREQAAVMGFEMPFQVAFESMNFRERVDEHVTQLMVYSVERRDGSLIMAGDEYDVASIEDPNSKNFVGYHIPQIIQQPAFGEEEFIRSFQRRYSAHYFQNPFTTQFKTFGRPTIRPFDIIDVVHQDPRDIVIRRNKVSNVLTTRIVRYRVTNVSSTFERGATGLGQYSTQITGEHI